jgi:hypothetical protein
MEVLPMRMQLLALVACLVGCGSKQGAATEPKEMAKPAVMAPATPPARPTVPAEIAVSEDHKLSLMANAKGVQIYECAADASGAMAWKLHGPRADLFDDAGNQIGIHFGGADKGLPPGPYWEAKDGSRVHAGKPASAPNQGSIALLRLEASDTSGTGVFSKVTFVHRLDTTGGVAPAGACTAGKTTEVPYTAKYYFYTAP